MTFERVSWDGPKGDQFFDWQRKSDDEMPAWFSISRPFSYFANKIEEHVPTDQMFHYTSADGALAIVESGRMRFTDYAYLNDQIEITYGLDIICEELRERAKSVAPQTLLDLLSDIENGDPLSSYNIYTASFSSAHDSLSQFRLYGPVAIGFDPKPMSFGSFKGDIYPGRTVYDYENQRKLIALFFDLFKQCEAKDEVLIKKEPEKRVSTDYILAKLLNIIAFFKHPAFFDERELRLVYSEPQKIMDWVGKAMAPRQFRASGGLIVPFTDTFDMANESSSQGDNKAQARLPIKSIVIGPTPNADALANGMRDLLSNRGYPDVTVSTSEAPFRA